MSIFSVSYCTRVVMHSPYNYFHISCSSFHINFSLFSPLTELVQTTGICLLVPNTSFGVQAFATQRSVLVNTGKIQNFLGCKTRSLRSRTLYGIVETTIMRRSYDWQKFLLSRCSWRCHKTSRYVFCCHVFICFSNHSSRSRTERDQFVFGCFYRSTA